MEDLVMSTRCTLAGSDLGSSGACAIRQALLNQGEPDVPSLRTINRILARRSLAHRSIYGRRPLRRRKPPPPRGWYLPDVVAGRAELDSVDIIEALVIPGGSPVQVLNAVSLHGGLTASWPVPAPVTARFTVAALTAHWRAVGLPHYAQFDNDSIFRGTHNSTVALGRVIRLCLSLGVTPVFVPPGEVGFQAMVEGYNGWWQAKV
jgi:putative transposase